ncbi:MAG: radical SAM family heme chaperone HemW [Bacteroidales bacterium]|nr:radical SAM family heme chaperone HemW [Bacteroidales bacterium]
MIYVHTPYCRRKCSYCAFYSVATLQSKSDYVAAICREIDIRPWPNTAVETLYFGGGTPSLLSVEELATIVAALRRRHNLDHLREATIECNPDDLTPQYLSELRQLDIFDRLSIGIQSFNDDELALLRRRHTSKQALEAIDNAALAGFCNISIDLIYGLPGSSHASWQHTLDVAATLPSAVKHLSAYSLSVEPATLLCRQVEEQKLTPAPEEEVLGQYQTLLNWAARQGYQQYEISNFAKPGHRSLHNSRYWTRHPYIGYGAAAHSFDGNYRRWNCSNIGLYISSLATGDANHESEHLSPTDAYNEALLTGLRTTTGIDLEALGQEQANLLLESAQPMVSNGLLTNEGGFLVPTEAGLLQADGIAATLFR